MYLWIRLKGYDIYIRVGSVSLGKGQKAFKTGPVNLKSILPRTSLKRIPTGVEHKNYQKPEPRLVFIATNNSNKNSYFYSDKASQNEFDIYLFPSCLTFSKQNKK